jgi:hypothetical protein
MEGAPKKDEKMKLPEDIYAFEYNGYSDDHIANTQERAEQIAPKLLKFLEQFSFDDRKKAVELFEQDFFVNAPASDPEEASSLLRQIYKEVLLLKL